MANVNIRVDSEIKKEASELFSTLGMDMSTAVNIFLRQAIYNKGIPFEIKIPNEETVKIIKEVDMKENLSKTFNSVDELMEDLNA
ncbi:MAG: type II toxin-antitoxin system RelB/DinJ family antitoxin [Clostridia bacterium]